MMMRNDMEIKSSLLRPPFLNTCQVKVWFRLWVAFILVGLGYNSELINL